jgi:ADP-ribose pyrophosphatase YjhB (NUDIX family)
MTDALWRLAHRLAARLYDARNYLLRPRVTGAVVLVRVADELLLVRASYRPWLTVPGGRVARGEPPLLAAVRELHEEVGLRVASEQLRPLGEFVIRHSNLEDHIHAYELRLDERPRVRIDMREITWAGFRPEATLETAELWPPLPRLLAAARAPGSDRRRPWAG